MRGIAKKDNLVAIEDMAFADRRLSANAKAFLSTALRMADDDGNYDPDEVLGFLGFGSHRSKSVQRELEEAGYIERWQWSMPGFFGTSASRVNIEMPTECDRIIRPVKRQWKNPMEQPGCNPIDMLSTAFSVKAKAVESPVPYGDSRMVENRPTDNITTTTNKIENNLDVFQGVCTFENEDISNDVVVLPVGRKSTDGNERLSRGRERVRDAVEKAKRMPLVNVTIEKAHEIFDASRRHCDDMGFYGDQFELSKAVIDRLCGETSPSCVLDAAKSVIECERNRKKRPSYWFADFEHELLDAAKSFEYMAAIGF